jgi:hypothetical protein
MLTYGCIFIFAMGMMFVWGTAWALTNPPPNTNGAELVAAMAFVVLVMFFGFRIILVSLWGFRQEMFTWTRIPIQFNRQTRTVHAYRGVGAKGVISVSWDKAFFFIEQRPQDPISKSTAYGLRCHVLDEQRACESVVFIRPDGLHR